MRTSVYVDGFNLYYQLKRHNAKWLDLLAFSKRVLPATAEVTAINYYTARVSGAVDGRLRGRLPYWWAEVAR